jgi:outer membrane immunogenic protein
MSNTDSEATMLKTGAIVATLFACSVLPCGAAGADWSGLYGGIHAGYALGDIDVAFESFSFPGMGSGFDEQADGALVGGQLGYQAQFGALVAGVEGSFDAGRVRGVARDAAAGDGFYCDTGCRDEEYFASDVDNIVMLTGRVGWASGPWLSYVKAGYASADVTMRGSLDVYADDCGSTPCIAGRGQTSERHHGWVIGGGLERKITERLSLGFDYSLIDLGGGIDRGTSHTDVGPDEQVGVIVLNVRPQPLHTLNVRLNYGF